MRLLPTTDQLELTIHICYAYLPHAYIYEIQVSYISYIYAFGIHFFRGIVQISTAYFILHLKARSRREIDAKKLLFGNGQQQQN